MEKWEGALERVERALGVSPVTRAQLGLVQLHGRSLIERTAEEAEREGGEE